MHEDAAGMPAQPGGSADLRHHTRARLRRWALRWALFILILGLVPAALEAQWGTVIGMTLLGGLPLGLHIWWAGTHPLPAPLPPPAVQDAVHPPYTPLGRLASVEAAAETLQARGWISAADHRAIRDRVVRLTDLVEVDARATALGGTASTVVDREIGRLQDSVLGLLDAAISSHAVAPGDADVDARLRSQRDLLRGRQDALDEVERRTDGLEHGGSA